MYIKQFLCFRWRLELFPVHLSSHHSSSAPYLKEEYADSYPLPTADEFGSAQWASGVNAEESPLELEDDSLGTPFLRKVAIFVVALGLVGVYIRTRSSGRSNYEKQG